MRPDFGDLTMTETPIVYIINQFGPAEHLGERFFIPRVGEYVYSKTAGHNVRVFRVVHTQNNEIHLITFKC